MVTVFTSTFNRAHLLPNLYQSLLAQGKMSFEWIIVDDGSVDGTKEVVDKFIDKSNFKIVYIYQENSGKHIAINKGVLIANSDIFFMVDSDDILPEDAIETIIFYFEKIKTNNKVCGVCFQKGNFNRKLIGLPFHIEQFFGNLIDFRYKLNHTVDKAEVFKTSVLKEFPFPAIQNEKFCMETLIWNRISKKYNILFVDKIVYLCEYLTGGLSDNIIRIRMNSPRSTLLTYKEMYELDIPIKQKFKAFLNYWRFSFNDKSKSIFQKSKVFKNPLAVIGIVPGFILYLRDLFIINKKRKL